MTPPAITAWAIKAPAGHILVDTIRPTRKICIKDKVLAAWPHYESAGYRCVRVQVTEIPEVPE